MNKSIQIGSLNMSYDQSSRVYSIEGISPTVMGNSHGKTTGGYNVVKILVHHENYKINKRGSGLSSKILSI